MTGSPNEICLGDLDPDEWALALELARTDGAVVRLGSISVDEVVLSGVVSPDQASLIMLNHATFGVDIDLGAAGLIQSSFDDVTFSGSASFAQAVFPERVAFARTRFEKSADFTEAQFGQDRVSFQSVVFSGSCSFAQARLAETTLFSGVKFHGPVVFDGAIAPSKFLTFQRCLFGSDLSMRGLVTGYDTKVTFTECELAEGGTLDGSMIGPGAWVNHGSSPIEAFDLAKPHERGRNSSISGYLSVQFEDEKLRAQPYLTPDATAAARMIKRLRLPASVQRRDSDLSFALTIEPVGDAQWRLMDPKEPDAMMVIDSAALEVEIARALAHFEVRAARSH